MFSIANWFGDQAKGDGDCFKSSRLIEAWWLDYNESCLTWLLAI